MNDHEAYEIIKKQFCKEINQIAEQVQKTQTMSIQDLEKLDKLFHAKKSMLTAKAMEDAEEYEEDGMSSGRRGRGMNGQYVSRAYAPMSNRQSYDEGYSRGYQDGQSGHWPTPPYYPKNW